MKALLLFGGNSDERLVSAASAQNLARKFPFDEIWYMHFGGAISKVTVDELMAHARPFEVEIQATAKPFAANLEAAIPAIGSRPVFLGFHGTQGEDGQIQALFEKHKIAFTGSGSSASADCFDKVKAKRIVEQRGLKLAGELVLLEIEKATWEARLNAFFAKTKKIVIKPIASGSSVGLHIVSNAEQLKEALGKIQASSYGNYLVEEFIVGRELTVGVLESSTGVRALPASEVVLDSGFSFDYQGKYLGRGTVEITPAKVSAIEMREAQALALAAHEALHCRGYTRTDMILTDSGPYYLETNTLPGMTKASFYPQQLEAAGLKVEDFLLGQLEIALARRG